MKEIGRQSFRHHAPLDSRSTVSGRPSGGGSRSVICAGFAPSSPASIPLT